MKKLIVSACTLVFAASCLCAQGTNSTNPNDSIKNLSALNDTISTMRKDSLSAEDVVVAAFKKQAVQNIEQQIIKHWYDMLWAIRAPGKTYNEIVKSMEARAYTMRALCEKASYTTNVEINQICTDSWDLMYFANQIEEKGSHLYYRYDILSAVAKTKDPVWADKNASEREKFSKAIDGQEQYFKLVLNDREDYSNSDDLTIEQFKEIIIAAHAQENVQESKIDLMQMFDAQHTRTGN